MMLGGIGAGVLLAVLYGLFWSYVADGLRDGLDTWAAARRAEGFQVSHGPVRVGGFPLRIEATIDDPTMARPGGTRSWSWRGPKLTFWARPWRISRFQVSAAGRHHVRVEFDDRSLRVTMDAAAVRLKARIRGARTGRVAVEIHNAEVIETDGGATLATVVAAHVIATRPADTSSGPTSHPKGALGLAVDIDGLVQQREPVPGLGRETVRLRAEGVLTGALPESFRRDALARWRDDGGTVDVGAVDLRHGPLTVAGDGTLALDGAMQPIGAFTLRVRGFAAALDGLREAGVIKRHPAALVKAMLGSMAVTPDDGGEPEIKVPLSIQDRRLYLGPVALARLRQIRWE